MEHFAWASSHSIFASLKDYAFLIALGISISVSYWYLLNRYRFLQDSESCLRLTRYQRLEYLGKHALLSMVFPGFVYLTIIYLMFFKFPVLDAPLPATGYSLDSVQEIAAKSSLLTHYKNSPKDFVQPINFVFITHRNIQRLLSQAGWIKNEMFGRDRIGVNRYVRLLRKDLPPVSYLYLDGRPQDFAYQFLSRSIVSRVHLRLWSFGHLGTRSVWLGSVSRDKEIDLGFYQHFPAPLHDIQHDVDRSRDFLLAKVVAHFPETRTRYVPWLKERMRNGNKRGDIEFQSDGKVLIFYVPAPSRHP